MLKETEERTLKDHETTMSTQNSFHETFKEKTNNELDLRQSTIDDLSS